MLKEHKHYSINVNITDGKGRPFKVRAVINNGSASNLIHPLLINRRKLPNKKYKKVIPI